MEQLLGAAVLASAAVASVQICFNLCIKLIPSVKIDKAYKAKFITL